MIDTLNAATPITNEKGIMTERMRNFRTQVVQESLIIGSGSPETFVKANKGAQYMDEDAAQGSVYYRKQKSDIGLDEKQGWVLIG